MCFGFGSQDVCSKVMNYLVVVYAATAFPKLARQLQPSQVSQETIIKSAQHF